MLAPKFIIENKYSLKHFMNVVPLIGFYVKCFLPSGKIKSMQKRRTVFIFFFVLVTLLFYCMKLGCACEIIIEPII